MTIKDAYKKEKLYKEDKQVIEKADHCISIGGSAYVSQIYGPNLKTLLRTASRWP